MRDAMRGERRHLLHKPVVVASASASRERTRDDNERNQAAYFFNMTLMQNYYENVNARYNYAYRVSDKNICVIQLVRQLCQKQFASDSNFL